MYQQLTLVPLTFFFQNDAIDLLVQHARKKISRDMAKMHFKKPSLPKMTGIAAYHMSKNLHIAQYARTVFSPLKKGEENAT